MSTTSEINNNQGAFGAEASAVPAPAPSYPPSIVFFDTTLRDGEQTPGASTPKDEKVKIAHRLAELGVNVIEAGFAASSQEDYEAIRAIAAEVAPKGVVVCSLARCCAADIDASAAALAPAIARGKGRIHVFIATSAFHMKTKLGKTPAEVLEAIRQNVAYARAKTPDVEFSAEDAFRSDRAFLAECVKAAVQTGATTVNLPDTVGQAVGPQYASFIADIIARAAVGPDIVFSTHCHNDKGFATANTLAALNAGARQVEVAMNGMGERAGNTALEEVAVVLSENPDVYPFAHAIRLEKIEAVSAEISQRMGVPRGNKPIVGENAFAHASGIHQHGLLKEMRENAAQSMYSAFNPAKIGRRHTLVITRHSGEAAVAHILEQAGVAPDAETVKLLTHHIKNNGGQTKVFSPEHVRQLYRSFRRQPQRERLARHGAVRFWESPVRGLA